VEKLITEQAPTSPREVRERAVALVFDQVKTGKNGPQWDVTCSVAAKVGGASSEVEYSGARHMDRICARRDGRAWEAAVHLNAVGGHRG
jgi:hypothetical protein